MTASTPAARPSLWAESPEAFEAAGYKRDAAHLFGRVQRVATWTDDGPSWPKESHVIREAFDDALPRIVSRVPSTDGSARVVLELNDGARIEAVHMPRATKRPRVTLCISSQVGCAIGCTFCATGRMGLVRNMTAGEIVGQCLTLMREMGPATASSLNLVFMGMGEPLHNVEAVIGALDVLCDVRGLGVAKSRITVSTSGLVPGIDRLASAKHRPELAISVNEVTDEARRSLMPLTRRYPLAELRGALERWPQRPHEKLTFEYVVLGGENHSEAHAERLAAFVRGFRHMLNLIPWNAWDGAAHRAPTDDEVASFAAALYARGCLITVRKTRGRDAKGACGTLSTASRRRVGSAPRAL